MKLFSRKNSTPIKGEFDVAQDKSISHRALMLGALATDAHDLLILEESAVSTIRMLFSHSIPLLLLG